MNKTRLFTLKAATALFSTVFLFSCVTTPTPQAPTQNQETTQQSQPEQNEQLPAQEKPHTTYLSRNLMAQGQLTPAQLTRYFMSQRPDADINEILNFAVDYVIEAKTEGLNSDVAFAQMCLETGYLRFGNLVQPEMHNYCGLGAMDAEHPGEYFATRTLGIRAHIQHLQAYATTEDVKLKNELIDPRYNWVHKTKYVETIEGLAGTWATDKQYAVKIEKILYNMEELIPPQNK